MPQLITEFLGTFFLVLTVGMTLLGVTGIPVDLAPFAIASVLTALVYAGSPVSGGHYNPAISVAVHLCGRITLTDLGRYIFAQLSGAACAAIVMEIILPVARSRPPIIETMPAFGAEALFTFALVWTFLMVALPTVTRSNQYYGLAVGGMALAGFYAAGPISGGALNPAITLGNCLLERTPWSALAVLGSAQMLAGALAAAAYRVAYPPIYVKPRAEAS